MAPGQVYESYFLDYHYLGDKKQDIEFEFIYKNREGNEFIQNIQINLSVFEHCVTMGKPFEQEIIKKLTDLNKSLNNISK